MLLPAAVQSELASSKAPTSVQHWIASLPAWVEVRDAPLSQAEDASLKGIDAGEKAAIQLARILDLAQQRGLADFAQAVERLRQTSFRAPHALLDALLEKHKEKGRV